MKDRDKNKEQLIGELTDLRQRVAELEAAEADREQAEEALRESEERYRKFVETSPDAIAISDLKGYITFISHVTLALFGSESENDVLGTSVLDWIVPEEHEKAIENIGKVLKGESSSSNQYTLLTVNGKRFFGEINTNVLQDAGGNPTAMISIIRDITERRRAEEALQESEERFRQMAENSRDVFWMRDLKSLDLVYITPAYERLWGRSIEDAYRQPTSWLTNIHPEDHERIATAFEKQVRGEPTENEYRIVWPDGSIHWIRDRVFPILDKAGEAYRAFGIMEDISERKQAEEKLRRVNRALKVLSECSQAVVRATGESRLLHDICRLIVKVGGYHLAWAGLAEQNERKTVHPVAQAGHDEGYLDTVDITWADAERGHGPTGTAIRTGEPSICRNVLSDPKYAPWRAEAIRRGYASSIALPLIADGQTLGALNIYAIEPNAFDTEETGLLVELADNLAHGVVGLRTRAERQRAEDALRESEKRFRDLFEGIPACCWAFDREGTVLHWNRACEQLYGWTAEQAVGKIMFELMVKDENVASTKETIAAVFQGQSFHGLEYEDRKANGTTCNVLVSEYPLKDAGDQVVMGICAELDITERKGAEQALRESEEKFRNLAEQSPNMIFINKAGKVVYANKRCEEVTGYTRDEFYAEDFDFLTLIAPDHRELVKASFSQHIVDQEVEPYEYTLVTKDRRGVEAIITTRLIDYEGEKAVLGIVTDIAEHKRAEEEIQRRALEQETLREAALALTTTLDRGEVIDRILAQLREVVPYDTASVQLLRENCLEIVGGRGFLNLEELLGMTFDPNRENNPNREVIRTRASFIVEDAPTMYEEFLHDPHAAAGIRSWLGVPMVVGERLIGMIALDKSEPRFYTQEHARLAEAFAAQAAIAVENARLHQEVLDHAEQLEQRVRERTTELQAQYARLDAILNSTTDGIVVADAEGSIVQTNPVAQAWLTETFPPEDAERLRDAVRKLARQAEKLPEVVLELTGLDLELRASPVTEDGAEEPSAAVVDIHDVSHLKALDRMKTIFVTNVSHELRQPVSTIKSYAYLMQRTPPADERWTEYLNSLVRETNRQAELVEDIMQISRIQAGRLRVDPHPTPLNELSKAVITSHQALAQERELALEYHLLEPGPVAPVDPKQMTQVLNILMGDAIRYTPEGGQVVISTGTEEAEEPVWATVTVWDTGKGILVEDLPYVFERFFREEEPRSVRASETGLRLMIVKGIVELHGGHVTVESEEGVGSTFTIWLPLTGRKGARNPQAQDPGGLLLDSPSVEQLAKMVPRAPGTNC